MQRVKYLDSANIYSEDENPRVIFLNENVRIITPDIIKKYKKKLKIIEKLNENKSDIFYSMYKDVSKWYVNEKKLNIDLEKIHIKSKLGSYMSGGCGIGASFLASFMASGLFFYMKNFGKDSIIIGISGMIILIGMKILSNEDKEVKMYNIFLQVLENIENDKIEKRG